MASGASRRVAMRLNMRSLHSARSPDAEDGSVLRQGGCVPHLPAALDLRQQELVIIELIPVEDRPDTRSAGPCTGK